MTQENGPATDQSGKGQSEVKQTPSLSNLDPRQALDIHPAAKIMPPMSKADYDRLVASIDDHGLQDPIEVFAGPGTEHVGSILDGINRQSACLKVDEPMRFKAVWTDDPVAYVLRKNLARRHLTSKGKRELVARLLTLNPIKSDSVLARETGISQPTITDVRRQLVDAGKIPDVEKVIGADGKAQSRSKNFEPDDDDELRSQIFGPDDKPSLEAMEAKQAANAEAEAAELEQLETGVSTDHDDADEGNHDDDDEAADGDEDDDEALAALHAKLSADELAALDAVPYAQLKEALAMKLSLDERATIVAMRVRGLLGRAFADSEVERLRVAKHEFERKCFALESELEELKEENAKLQAALAAAGGEVV